MSKNSINNQNNNFLKHPFKSILDFAVSRASSSLCPKDSRSDCPHILKFRNNVAHSSAKSAFTFAELMISLLVISILSAILYPTIAHFTPNSNKPLFKSAYRMLSTVVNEIVNENPNGHISDEIADQHIDFCKKFCAKANVVLRDVTNKGNGVSDESCNTNCADAANNWIQTSNGMRWRFYPYDTYTSPCPNNGYADRTGGNAVSIGADTYKIFVDVNASNNELTQQSVGAPREDVPDGVSGKDIDNMFGTCIDASRKGGCGVFYFDQFTNANTGIYTTIPNYSNNTPASFNADHLKIQDTFEILVDNKGKIRDMSPAAWANLEDHTSAGN